MTRPVATISILLALAGAHLRAQEPRPAGSGAGHTLGGHVFQPSSDFPTPFVASYLRSLIGFGGATNVSVPVYNAADSVVATLQGDLAFLNMDLEYQQRIASRFALRVGTTASLRSGTDRPTLLSEGISSVYGFGLGAMGRIFQSGKVVVSGSLDVSSTGLVGVTPLEFAQGVAQTVGRVLDSLQSVGGIVIDSAVIDSVIKSIDLTGYSLYDQDHVRSTVLGARVAWAPVPWLGVTGMLQGGVSGLFNGPSDQGLVDVGASADVDFGALWKVPIGLMISERWTSISERSSDIGKGVTKTAIGLAYTGRSDFSVGLDLLFANFEQRKTSTTTTGKRAGLALRYYF